MTSILVASFLAGILTILAPCTLPLLPIIIGRSTLESNVKKPLIITASLAVSIIIFTFLLKVSTAFIGVPPKTWSIIAGIILIILGVSMLTPKLWQNIMYKCKFESLAQKSLESGKQKQGLASDIITGVALGPVFTSCSPTFGLIIAIILPTNIYTGTLYIITYAIGVASAMCIISIFGQQAVKRLRWAAKPNGILKRSIAILVILVGIAITTGLDKEIESKILDTGYYGITEFEENQVKKLKENLK